MNTMVQMMYHQYEQPMISKMEYETTSRTLQSRRLRKSQNVIVLSDGAPRCLGSDYVPGPGDGM